MSEQPGNTPGRETPRAVDDSGLDGAGGPSGPAAEHGDAHPPLSEETRHIIIVGGSFKRACDYARDHGLTWRPSRQWSYSDGRSDHVLRGCHGVLVLVSGDAPLGRGWLSHTLEWMKRSGAAEVRGVDA